MENGKIYHKISGKVVHPILTANCIFEIGQELKDIIVEQSLVDIYKQFIDIKTDEILKNDKSEPIIETKQVETEQESTEITPKSDYSARVKAPSKNLQAKTKTVPKTAQ